MDECVSHKTLIVQISTIGGGGRIIQLIISSTILGVRNHRMTNER